MLSVDDLVCIIYFGIFIGINLWGILLIVYYLKVFNVVVGYIYGGNKWRNFFLDFYRNIFLGYIVFCLLFEGKEFVFRERKFVYWNNFCFKYKGKIVVL